MSASGDPPLLMALWDKLVSTFYLPRADDVDEEPLFQGVLASLVDPSGTAAQRLPHQYYAAAKRFITNDFPDYVAEVLKLRADSPDDDVLLVGCCSRVTARGPRNNTYVVH